MTLFPRRVPARSPTPHYPTQHPQGDTQPRPGSEASSDLGPPVQVLGGARPVVFLPVSEGARAEVVRIVGDPLSHMGCRRKAETRFLWLSGGDVRAQGERRGGGLRRTRLCMCVGPDARRRGVHRCQRHTEAGKRRVPHPLDPSPPASLWRSVGVRLMPGIGGWASPLQPLCQGWTSRTLLPGLYGGRRWRGMGRGVGTLSGCAYICRVSHLRRLERETVGRVYRVAAGAGYVGIGRSRFPSEG